MIYTTLNRIRGCGPCQDGWEKLLTGLGKTHADDEPLDFLQILAINGVSDAIWAMRVEPQHERVWRLFAVRCAREVQHLMTDLRSIAALDVAERYANGEASAEDLTAAWVAAREADWEASEAAMAAAWVADAAWEASRTAARAASEASASAAWVADAAWEASHTAAGAAAWAAGAEDWAAARAAAGVAARQTEILRELLEECDK